MKKERICILCNHVSFVNVTLDLLSHTRTLYPQTMLNTMSQLEFGALGRLRQQLFNPVLSRQLHELRLSSLRVDGILPSACHGVFVESKWIGSLLLEWRRSSAGSDERRWRPARKEALQRLWEALCELDEAGGRGHGRYKVPDPGIGLVREGEGGMAGLFSRIFELVAGRLFFRGS